jgi:ornithine cyclodeaminase/alanine dehydrogenase-like protein (mu-crystallin family)
VRHGARDASANVADHGPVYPAVPLPGRNTTVLRFVTSEDVHRACAWPALVAALRAAHRGPRPLIARCSIEGDVRGVAQTYLNLPAVLPGVAMGTKLVTILPGNPGRGAGVPAVQAVYVLFDGGDGSPAAVIDGTALTYRKTAADSALGSQILSREDARVLVVVGAGGLAPFLARAHLATRPSLTTVLVWNRTAHRADTLARALRDEGVDATATTDLAAAVRRADIVSCATAATAPLVSGDWLRPGAHLDLAGGFTPDARMRRCRRAPRPPVRRRGERQRRAVREPDRPDPAGRGAAGEDRGRPVRPVPARLDVRPTM